MFTICKKRKLHMSIKLGIPEKGGAQFFLKTQEYQKIFINKFLFNKEANYGSYQRSRCKENLRNL